MRAPACLARRVCFVCVCVLCERGLGCLFGGKLGASAQTQPPRSAMCRFPRKCILKTLSKIPLSCPIRVSCVFSQGGRVHCLGEVRADVPRCAHPFSWILFLSPLDASAISFLFFSGRRSALFDQVCTKQHAKHAELEGTRHLSGPSAPPTWGRWCTRTTQRGACAAVLGVENRFYFVPFFNGFSTGLNRSTYKKTSACIFKNTSNIGPKLRCIGRMG